MALQTGDYEPHTTKRVYVWKAPDVNGNGEQVTRPKLDSAGNNLGQEFVMDRGQPVKHYKVPDGFREVRSFDGSVAHVLHDADGNIVRNKRGEAVNIRPGHAVIVHPDNTTETLPDDWSQYLFEQSHKRNGTAPERTAEAVETVNPTETDEYAEFLAWKASRGQ